MKINKRIANIEQNKNVNKWCVSFVSVAISVWKHDVLNVAYHVWATLCPLLPIKHIFLFTSVAWNSCSKRLSSAMCSRSQQIGLGENRRPPSRSKITSVREKKDMGFSLYSHRNHHVLSKHLVIAEHVIKSQGLWLSLTYLLPLYIF